MFQLRFPTVRWLITLLLVMLSLVCVSEVSAVNKEDKTKLTLTGRVKESAGRKDLVKSKVIFTDADGKLVGDTMTAGGRFFGDMSGNVVERAVYEVVVPRKDAVYTVEVIMAGYDTLFQTVTVDQIGRREYTRQIPDLLMKRESRKLGEVTVSASKVKFYNRGDTLVYDADAFELAEGSMLDALIKQLPGVELKEGGQIYVNGEYVENLLLNGKDFFNGNNELMLDNLAAYTVKNVEVYKKTSDFDKWAGIKGKQDLTMDVKLKREYNAGWIINLEAGGGTSDRYMGRAFVNRFSNNSRLTLIGNINNLNDNRKPGESTTWTPETNTTGTMRTKMGAFDYLAQESGEAWKVNGNVMVRHTSQDDSRDVQRTNFLTSDRTYDYNFQRNRMRQLNVNTRHNVIFQEDKKYYASAYVSGDYNKTNSDVSYRSATFNNERPTVTMGTIDSLYNGSPSELDDIINRTLTTTKNTGHAANAAAGFAGNLSVPKTNDYISLTASGTYSGSKNEVWRDYIINYGDNPAPAIRENQYFDNSPNRSLTFNVSTSYGYAIDGDTRLALRYAYGHTDTRKDSYMYALDRLADQGVIGTLPAGYLSAIDASRSYKSHTVENNHTIELDFTKWGDNFSMYFSPQLRFVNRDFSYYRNEKDYKVNQRHTLVSIPNYASYFGWTVSKRKINGREIPTNMLSLNLTMVPKLPDPSKMVDVTDNNDPQNIWVGKPSLTNSMTYGSELNWTLNAPIKGRILRNTLTLVYSNNHNELVSGYTYDMSTGVRVNKTYNVKDGNYVAKIHVDPYYQFGSKGQFSMFYRGGLDYIHSADMIGINGSEPTKSTVETYWQAHTLNFTWQLGKQQLSFMGQVNSRHTTSDRTNFESITATHSNLSLRGQFKLPKGFGISTDFTVYMRRGYGSQELDTTDPVWNARLSYTPPKSKWVIMLDGFDMLHQLSNVNYAVDSKGRTVTYTNVLPRYFMLHAQYRINIQPKKKIIDNNRNFIFSR